MLSLQWLTDQVIFSFEKVDKEGDLLKKANAHRASLLLRCRIGDDFEVTEEVEQQLADAALACANENILSEVKYLLEAILHKMNSVTQEMLQLEVLDKIDEVF